MIERRIIAQNITNLTDARYFAAWGVSYVSFNVMQASPFKVDDAVISEISDWLEGPEVLLETDELEFEDLADGYIMSNIYSSMPLSKPCFFRIDWSEIEKGLPSGKYILKPRDKSQLVQLHDLPTGYWQGIELFIDITDIPIASKADLGDFGIVVQGGDEEKPGVKSFDDLDELYDLLMD